VEGPGRARSVNGTISYMPPLFGLMLAGAVVKALLES
jgi:tRNA A37 threonylcarbamoyladenosine dehydratase